MKKELPNGWVLSWNASQPRTVYVDDERNGTWSDSAIIYSDGRVAFDFPERIPQTVKTAVKPFWRKASKQAFSSSPRRVSKDQMSFMFEAPAAPSSRIRVKPAKKAAKKVAKKRSSLGMPKLVPYRISGEDMAMLRRIDKAKPSRKGRHKGHRRWEVWSREGGKLTHKAASFQRKDRAELMARESRRLFGGSYSVVDAWGHRRS